VQEQQLQQLADMVAQRIRPDMSVIRRRHKRKPQRVPEYLTEEEISSLLGVIKDVRDQAMFAVAYYRGLRASELGMIDVNDYHAAYGRLTIRRLKGSRGGEYHLTPAERFALKAWLRKRGTTPGRLFLSRNGRGISRSRLHRLMRKYCALAGIDQKKAHMHALKHSCVTHLSAVEQDIVAIQDHLGHSNIQNTMKYIQISSQRRREFADRLNRQGSGSKRPKASLQ
jgi:integrase